MSGGVNAGRRDRAEKTCDNVVKVRLSDDEMAILGAAARSGMALAAWLGQASMDTAEHGAVPKMQGKYWPS